jgi:sterol desaturase/sphingolipid hydroxylase (fatty acid hydroxylase superfamily)
VIERLTSQSQGAIPVIAAFLLLLALETLRPLRRPKRALKRRVPVNLALTFVAFAVGVAVVRPAALAAAAWAGANSFGLLPYLGWLGLPSWGRFIMGFLLMDLTFYYWHRANHVYPLLWRFHNVHHVDPDLDVTTSFRFHFGEVFYSTAFRLLQVGLSGVSPAIYVAYELAFNLETIFHHSNVRLPLAWERALNLIIVTPRMHGIHHSVMGSETNSNYAVIFRWWDRVHRTLRLNVQSRDIIIGVPGYLLPKDNRAGRLLRQPFTRQRPYWRWPSGQTPVRAQGEVADPRFLLA